MHRPEAIAHEDAGTGAVHQRDPSRAATSACASSVSSHGITSARPARIAGDAGRGHRLQARDDERRPARRRQDEHRQPLQGHRDVAGEIPEVRPDAHEERRDPALGEERLGVGPSARRSACRGWRGARRSSRQVRPSAGPASAEAGGDVAEDVPGGDDRDRTPVLDDRHVAEAADGHLVDRHRDRVVVPEDHRIRGHQLADRAGAPARGRRASGAHHDP